MKRVLIIMLMLIMAVVMIACGDDEAVPAEDAPMLTVEINIDYPDDSGMEDVEEFALQVAEGSSALDMLHAYGEAEGVEIVMSDTSTTAYVTSIGGVAETDNAGWVYEVNDEMTMDAADEHIIEPGTEITWEFMSWNDMD